MTTVALIATCSSYAYADTEPLTLTFNETEAPIVLLSENDLLVNETGNSAFLTATTLPSSSDGLILAGTTSYTNGTYKRSNETEHLTGGQNFQSYKSILFDENEDTSASSSVFGGAIYVGSGSTLSFSNNSDITFSGNTASATDGSYDASGGAIFASYNSSTLFSNNGDITFSGNTASATGSYTYGCYGCGGAIYASRSCTLSFTDNGDITFSGNTASSTGGATSSYSSAFGGAIEVYSTLSFTDNGNITFSKNSASSKVRSVRGGAIYAGEALTFIDNGDITFSGNTVSGYSTSVLGGAIYAESTLTIQGSALFEKNTEISYITYRLRSIYQGAGGSLELSAPTDKRIEFHDSIYSEADTVSLNKDYTKSDGSTQTADGSIRFTGATTEADLKAMKGKAGTEKEITNSRTSELKGDVTLYGGNLIIEEKAILNLSGSLTVKGGNITVATGAQLNLAKADITMPSLTLSGGTVTLGTEGDHAATLITTTLTVTDDSKLNADLVMASGTLTFSKDATLTMGCSVTLGDDVVVVLDDDVVSGLQNGTIANYELMDSVESATVGSVTITNTKGEAMESGWTIKRTTDGKLTVTPEPTTATLSLLALIVLASRRRRR